MKTMMVRVLLETSNTEHEVADALMKGLQGLPSKARLWLAFDHPDQAGAKKLWTVIESGQDPNRKGVAR